MVLDCRCDTLPVFFFINVASTTCFDLGQSNIYKKWQRSSHERYKKHLQDCPSKHVVEITLYKVTTQHMGRARQEVALSRLSL